MNIGKWNFIALIIYSSVVLCVLPITETYKIGTMSLKIFHNILKQSTQNSLTLYFFFVTQFDLQFVPLLSENCVNNVYIGM
jgi:hypothetical protein